MADQSDLDPTVDFDPDDMSGRESMYSPASSYSTYSREVKYIFEPQGAEEDSQEEYPDYSHIGPRTASAKQQTPLLHHHHQQQQHRLSNSNSSNNNHFIAHTPRTLSAASSHYSDGGNAANKENRTPSGQFHHHHNNRLSNFRHELPSTEEDSLFENSPSPSSCQAFQYNHHKHHYSSNNGANDLYHQNPLCSPRERGSYDRGPISPGMEEALYSSTSTFTGHNESAGKPNSYSGVHPRKNSTISEQSYFSPAAAAARNGTLPLNCRSPPDRNSYGNTAQGLISPTNRHHTQYFNQQQQQQQQQQHQHPQYMAFSKHAYPAIYRSSFSGGAGYYNANNRAGGYPQHHRHDQSAPMSPRERFAGIRANEAVDGARNDRVYPLQNASSHQQHHYAQQVHPHPQQSLGGNHHHTNNSNHCQQPRMPHPPYPQPPRYDYQAHRRRKTWSPPIMKLGPLAASSSAIADATLSSEGNAHFNIPNGVSSEHRPFYSNDSLLDYLTTENGSRAQVEQRKAQSLSEDLDVTPPRLAPISGVLAQVS